MDVLTRRQGLWEIRPRRLVGYVCMSKSGPRRVHRYGDGKWGLPHDRNALELKVEQEYVLVIVALYAFCHHTR